MNVIDQAPELAHAHSAPAPMPLEPEQSSQQKARPLHSALAAILDVLSSKEKGEQALTLILRAGMILVLAGAVTIGLKNVLASFT